MQREERCYCAYCSSLLPRSGNTRLIGLTSHQKWGATCGERLGKFMAAQKTIGKESGASTCGTKIDAEFSSVDREGWWQW